MRERTRKRVKEERQENRGDRRERIQGTDECARIGAGQTKEKIGQTRKEKQGRARAKRKGEREQNRGERYGSGSSRRAEQTAGERRTNNRIEKKE
jgi:hypothetical protein